MLEKGLHAEAREACPSMHRAPLWVVAAVLCGSTAACRRAPDGEATDPREPAARAGEAEARLRAWGAGRFDVVSFQAADEHPRTLEDDFHARSHLYVVPFTARVRFTRVLEIDELSASTVRVGEPGWSPERQRDGVMLTQCFGAGSHAAGEELDVSASAVFEDLEPGWRFRAFDEVH